MAGRFSNLEFEQSVEPQSAAKPQSRGEPLPDAQHYMLRAREESSWGAYEPALRLYTRALNEDRAMIPAWVGQVQMLVQLGEVHEARVWADKALELFRDNGELLAAKAQACARLEDRTAALACSDGSLRAAGSSPWRWIARGEVLLAKKQKHAEECFQRAIAEPAADWLDRVVIATVFLYYRRATNALFYLKKSLELEPAHGYTWYLLGECQTALGMNGPASDSYSKCLELRADFRPANNALDQIGGNGIIGVLRGWVRRWRHQ